MTVTMPNPPIWIRSRMTICPNRLHVEAVGRVTSPVTQVEVVDVNSASRYGTASPLAELRGNVSRILPRKMGTRKLSSMICVVDRVIFFFFFMILYPILFPLMMDGIIIT